ncbi:ESX secretion-associated protein EspG [Amycolatopsis pigmentata]|uniref:ESX secretion-associated protein EspG n=1 Tax=Amycolatopsis pigmentata TaxID=450801 RepID=A0ABW5FYU9_9PSEU
MWFEEAERFHVDELAALVSEEAGDELHIVLAPQPVWRSEEAVRVLAPPRRTKPGEPSPADIAGLLSRPEEARYGWSSDLVNDIHLRTLVAARPEFGLIAVREDEEVFVRTFRCDHLSSVLARVLPKDSWKSPEPAITVPRSEILAADPETIGAPRPSREVARAQALAAARPFAIAEFHVEIRQCHRRHVSGPVRVYDTDEGRWAVTARPRYGDEILRFVPADTGVVADLLDDLRRDLS